MVLDLVDCTGVIAGIRTCRKNGENLVLVEGIASNWAVNGIVGGNSTVGTIVGTNLGATYKAPASKPAPASVSVSAKVAGDATFPLLIVVANLTITDTAAYRGTINYDLSIGPNNSIATGVANIDWTSAGGFPDVSYYAPSGTMTGIFRAGLPSYDCNEITATVPIAPDFRNGTSTALVVFNATAGIPNSLNFQIKGDKSTVLTFNCKRKSDGSTLVYPVNGSNYNIIVPGCLTATGGVPFTNESRLTGTFSCPGGNTFSWDFLKQ